MNDVLLDELRRLEELLHTSEVRQDPAALGALLHEDFEEFGRSGRRYTRADVLDEFKPGEALPTIRGERYEVTRVGEDAALLTYTSAHVDQAGHAHRHTLRSSLWVRAAGSWKLRFHQGTPMTNGSDAA